MKKLIVMLVILGSVMPTHGQDQKMSKAEKKQLVARAKKFKSNPQSLKDMLQELETLKSAAASSRDQIALAEDRARTAEENASNSQSEVERLRRSLAEAQQKTNQVKTEAITTGYRLPQNGTVFRVQIGGYKKRDLAGYVDNSSETIQVEKNASGITEITVGQFQSYRKADELKKHLRAMGVKDAWIVPYKDGSRVLLKEVLSEIDK